MYPLLNDKDYILTKKINVKDELQIGDVVEIKHPDLGRLIKKIKKIKPKKILVSGESAVSIESFNMGWVKKSHVIGKLVLGITSKEGLWLKKKFHNS